MKNVVLLVALALTTIIGKTQTIKNTSKQNKLNKPTAKSVRTFDSISVTTKAPKIVGTYKLISLKNDAMQADTSTIDSIAAMMANISLDRRAARGDSLRNFDSSYASISASNELKYIFSFTYILKANNTFVFTVVENFKPIKTNGTYKYDDVKKIVSFKIPKQKDSIFKYDSETETFQNILNKKNNELTVLLFKKIK
jgi:hypothetical protein